MTGWPQGRPLPARIVEISADRYRLHPAYDEHGIGVVLVGTSVVAARDRDPKRDSHWTGDERHHAKLDPRRGVRASLFSIARRPRVA